MTLSRVSMILLEKAVARTIMRVIERIPPMRVVCSGSPRTRRRELELKRSAL